MVGFFECVDCFFGFFLHPFPHLFGFEDVAVNRFLNSFLDRFGYLLGPMYVIPTIMVLGLCVFIGCMWTVMPASFWVGAAMFLRWWGVALVLMGTGAYLTGGPGYEDDRVNKLQWGAFLAGFGLCWFFCGLYMI